MKQTRYLISMIALALIIWACSSDGSSTDDVEVPVTFDRGDMLANWADNIIIPSYTAFQSELLDLQSSYETFVVDQDISSLDAVRTSWENAYRAWQHVSLFEIGPAEAIGYRLNMNTYPADSDLVDVSIATGVFDLSLPSNRDAKGFAALDYILNGFEGDDATLIVLLTSAASDPNRQDYFAAMLADMLSLTNDVVGQWEGSYRDTFVDNDGASATASVDRFVNDYIFYYEKFLRAGKIGIPIGVFSGSTEVNTLEVFYRPELSKDMFLEGLDAVQGFFNGKHYGSSVTGESLASYLEALNTLKDGADLAGLINDQMDDARDIVSALGDFKTEIEAADPPVAMFLAYDEVQKVVPLFKVDMVSAMSINIDFVDADGD